jgi:hypothetical protein
MIAVYRLGERLISADGKGEKNNWGQVSTIDSAAKPPV